MAFVPTPFLRYFNPAVTVTMLGQVASFLNAEGFTISFMVTRSLEPVPDSAEVRIANLDPDLALLMGKVFAARTSLTPPAVNQVIVTAGYDAFLAGLFKGDIRSFQSSLRDGPDTWTVATADDGGDAIVDALINPPISTAGSTAALLIQAACGGMGLLPGPSVAIVLSQIDPGPAGAFSGVMAGKWSEVLDHVARRLRCRWWVRDGMVHLGFRGQPDPSRPAVVLTDDILVEPISEGGSGLVTLATFMDPSIVPGGQVQYLGTSFRCESVVSSGETRGSTPWVSRVIGRAL